MSWMALQERTVNLAAPREVATVRQFLARFGLGYTTDVELTLTWWTEDERLVATGSLRGEVLRNIAVDDTYQGEGLSATVVSRLMQEAAQRGRYHYFIYTKPDKAYLFTALGFQEVGRGDPYAVLLEAGLGSVQDYCADLAQKVRHLPTGRRAGIVMNANPFTRGHRALIEAAAAACDSVVVLVVTEDLSLFPFAHRLPLIQEGVRDLPQVAVVAGGPYIISSATFPSYFTRGEDEAVTAQTRLDVDIFARHIAPAAGITVRYVGEEPYCPVTAAYNQAMREILPRYGLDLVVVPRLAVGGEAVSASTVRELIRQQAWDKIRPLVPDVTWRYLHAEEARPVLAKIKASHSRH